MKYPYADLLELPHPQSKKHPRMSNAERASQFSPFAALVGYGDAVQETARRTEQRQTPDESVWEELNRTLFLLREKPSPVRVTYFVPDARKEGGAYVTRDGVFLRVDEPKQSMLLTDGTVIPLAELSELQIRSEE